jgi:hypothetical protein
MVALPGPASARDTFGSVHAGARHQNCACSRIEAAARFNADQLHVLVADESVEHPDRVRASAATQPVIGQAAFALEISRGLSPITR